MMFWKFQANGNDFILLKHGDDVVDVPKWCHRQFGIGADGILVVKEEEDGLVYTHYNADGSLADLCVNGIRCVALWYFQHQLRKQVTITIANRSYLLTYDDENRVSLHTTLPKAINDTVYLTGVLHEIVEVFPEEPKDDRNYNIITQINQKMNEIAVSTWERGVGPTLSCGSGMISAYYHCFHAGLVGHRGMVHSKGGSADIFIEDHVLTFSSAVYCVFTGIFNQHA